MVQKFGIRLRRKLPGETPPPAGEVTVTINVKSGQASPTTSPSILFDVLFSEAVTGFVTGDVTLGGTAGAALATVAGSGAAYTVTVTGMTQSGTVIASIGANKAVNSSGVGNKASTSTNNTVVFSSASLVVSDVGSFSAVLNVPVSTTAQKLYAVVIPGGAAAPSADQIKRGKKGDETAATWVGGGTVYNVGQGNVVYMPGPNYPSLFPNTAYDVYMVEEGGSPVSFGAVYNASFTTLKSAPKLMSTTPSHNWKTARLAGDISMVFDQAITLGTGTVILRDVDLGLSEETFNVEQPLGTNSGTLSIATTNLPNDTLVINPGNSLTARKNYAIRISPTAIKNASADLAYAGLADDLGYAFRAGYATGNAKQMAGALLDVLAIDLTDDSCFIKRTNTNPGAVYDGLFTDPASGFTAGAGAIGVGNLKISEKGMRVNTSNWMHILTDLIPYSNLEGTLLVELSAQNLDTAAGTVTNQFGAVCLTRSSLQTSDLGHFLQISKSDTGDLNSGMQVVWRNEATGTYAQGHKDPGSMPNGGVFGVLGITWNASEIILSNGLSPYEINGVSRGTTTYSGPNWTNNFPDDFKRLRLGPVQGGAIYHDIRRVMYRPAKLTASELDAAVNSLNSFVSA
jgi:hypothetical protein